MTDLFRRQTACSGHCRNGNRGVSSGCGEAGSGSGGAGAGGGDGGAADRGLGLAQRSVQQGLTPSGSPGCPSTFVARWCATVAARQLNVGAGADDDAFLCRASPGGGPGSRWPFLCVVCRHVAADGVAVSGLAAGAGRRAFQSAGRESADAVCSGFVDAFANGAGLLTYLEFPRLSREAHDLSMVDPRLAAAVAELI